MMLDNAIARAFTEVIVGNRPLPIACARIFFVLRSFAFYSGKRFHL